MIARLLFVLVLVVCAPVEAWLGGRPRRRVRRNWVPMPPAPRQLRARLALSRRRLKVSSCDLAAARAAWRN